MSSKLYGSSCRLRSDETLLHVLWLYSGMYCVFLKVHFGFKGKLVKYVFLIYYQKYCGLCIYMCVYIFIFFIYI